MRMWVCEVSRTPPNSASTPTQSREPPGVRRIHVVKRRCVRRKTIDWITLHRHLPRDFEALPSSSEALIYVTVIDNVSKRITGETTPT